jgi:small subunit ribosomal protein S1
LTFHLYNMILILSNLELEVFIMENNNALIGHGPEADNEQMTENPPELGGQEMTSMESLLEEQGLSLEFPNQGEIRQGFIATIRDNEILVSIGTKSEGVISARELEQIPSEERAAFTIGQEIPVFVVAPEDANGNVVLSYVRAREEKDWEIVESLLSTGDSYPSKIIGFNKGGLIVPIGGLRGFVPASQISLTRRSAGNESPEQRWGRMVGEEMNVRVIEVDRERRRLILSERMALQETRETLKDRLLDELQEGSIRTGRVTSLADFGAFVNIEGADGLVHLSEISWERIQHPNEVLKVGQEVKVKVISIDRDRKRIGLSMRQLQEDPWLQKVGHLKEGMLVEGTITHLTKFGAFARLDEDLEGLIHVSELSEQRVAHPKEVLREGEVVTLRVIKIDPERRRIGLSLRKVDSPAYADLDWKMALSDEVGKVHDAGAVVEPETEPETELEAEVDEQLEAEVDEQPEAEVDEQPEAEVDEQPEAE